MLRLFFYRLNRLISIVRLLQLLQEITYYLFRKIEIVQRIVAFYRCFKKKSFSFSFFHDWKKRWKFKRIYILIFSFIFIVRNELQTLRSIMYRVRLKFCNEVQERCSWGKLHAIFFVGFFFFLFFLFFFTRLWRDKER